MKRKEKNKKIKEMWQVTLKKCEKLIRWHVACGFAFKGLSQP